ncbi:MAG: ATP-binding protein, partial [Phycisphaerales bacterium]
DPPPFDEGYVLETRILNTRHNITLNFDERSTGFAWFFSFLVWFYQVKRTYGDNLFVLLDDPGIGLHARAQEDLLGYISRELKPHYQVIYTTHSPFMIRTNSLGQCRTVEDVVTTDDQGREKFLGTKVGQQVLSTNPDTLIPLRAALGYEISRTMNGQRTLLVETPTDAMYLNWFSRRLVEEDRMGLGPGWSIVPCGGGERVGAFLGIFGGDKGNVVALMGAVDGQERLEQPIEQQLLRGSRIFSLGDFVSTVGGSIEDLIGSPTYLGLVNLCYGLPRRARLSLSKPPEESRSLLRHVEEHFATVGLGAGAFDRYKPAEFLAENTKKCLKKLPNLGEALDRFEKLFAEINAC